MQRSPTTRHATTGHLYAVNLERTLLELQRRVDEHEAALTQLSNASAPDPPLTPEASLTAISRGYLDAAASEPFTPYPGSVLPALLALRRTTQTVAESHAYLRTQEASLDSVRRRLDVEQANLRDQQALQAALEARIQALQGGLESQVDVTPEQMMRERAEKLRQEKCNYDKERSALMRELLGFIDQRLGPMLAAEELGGPVVGDLMDIDSDGLGAGFSAQGKPKKSRKEPSGQPRARDGAGARQRRIDEIWGREEEDGEEGEEEQERARGPWGGEQSGQHERDEASAAGAELRSLTEALLNALMEARGDSSAAYVKMPRESAGARFLVRSKVAQFHPKDATRLRLIDFGREIDD